jgi:N-acetylglucosaminyldiphosphoundecaprenol N-acetyl-beta-D-mannosaminyltransferase
MKVRLCGFWIENVSMREAVEEVLRLQRSDSPAHVGFLNAHYVNVAACDDAYDDALRRASVLFADGSGMRLAGRLRGVRLEDNVNGTDMFPLLAKAMAREGRSIFLLGGRPGIADGVRQWLSTHAPSLDVRGASHGYRTEDEWQEVVSEVREARPDLLMVAMGAPFQDVWIRRHLEKLGVPVVMSVGGLFDFYSGRIPRAPRAIRAAGLEWAFRLAQEPARLWRRYLLGNAVFVARAVVNTFNPVPTEVGR